MRVHLLNGLSNSAPYEAVLDALGHHVEVQSLTAALSGHPTTGDVVLWNLSFDDEGRRADHKTLVAMPPGQPLPCVAVMPQEDQDLEGFLHSAGVDVVLRQPTSARDLNRALERASSTFNQSKQTSNVLPLVLVAGEHEEYRRVLKGAPLSQVVFCLEAVDWNEADRLCRQIAFDSVIICERAGSLQFHQLLGRIQVLCGDAVIVGFLEEDNLSGSAAKSHGVAWVSLEKGAATLFRVMSDALEQRSREAWRKALDVEIISKQQELQRVNAMLRTINKAFRDTNLRLEREGHTKDQMIGVAAHELKSPLAAMAGALDVLCEDLNRFESQDRQLLELMQRNNARMIKLVENVLDLSRVESRRITLKPQSCVAMRLVEQAIETVMLKASDKGVRFETVNTQNLEKWWVDPEAVLQMLVNLLDNAVKFSPRGGLIRIIVRLVGREIHFAVSDEGPGIPEEERTLVFERFHHRSRGEDMHSAGSGLGLTITQALARYLKGRVTVGESPTGGAQVTISLPFAPVTEDAAASPQDVLPLGPPGSTIGSSMTPGKDDT